MEPTDIDGPALRALIEEELRVAREELRRAVREQPQRDDTPRFRGGTRGGDESWAIVPDTASRSLSERVEALQDMLELLDRFPSLSSTLHLLFGRLLQATEDRLLRRIADLEQQATERARDQQAQAEAHAQHQQTQDELQHWKQEELQRKQEGRQRVENILISLVSLIFGWLVSLLGTPASVLQIFTHH